MEQVSPKLYEKPPQRKPLSESSSDDVNVASPFRSISSARQASPMLLKKDSEPKRYAERQPNGKALDKRRVSRSPQREPVPVDRARRGSIRSSGAKHETQAYKQDSGRPSSPLQFPWIQNIVSRQKDSVLEDSPSFSPRSKFLTPRISPKTGKSKLPSSAKVLHRYRHTPQFDFPLSAPPRASSDVSIHSTDGKETSSKEPLRRERNYLTSERLREVLQTELEGRFARHIETILRKSFDETLRTEVEELLRRQLMNVLNTAQQTNRSKADEPRDLGDSSYEDGKVITRHLPDLRLTSPFKDELRDEINQTLTEAFKNQQLQLELQAQQQKNVEEQVKLQLERHFQNFRSAVLGHAETAYGTLNTELKRDILEQVTPLREQIVSAIVDLKETLVRQRNDDNVLHETAYKKHVEAVESAYVQKLREAVEEATNYKGSAKDATEQVLEQKETVRRLNVAVEHLLDVNRVARDHLDQMEEREKQLHLSLDTAVQSQNQIQEYLKNCVPLATAKKFASQAIRKGRGLQGLHDWEKQVRHALVHWAFCKLRTNATGGKSPFQVSTNRVLYDQLHLLAENEQLHHAVRHFDSLCRNDEICGRLDLGPTVDPQRTWEERSSLVSAA